MNTPNEQKPNPSSDITTAKNPAPGVNNNEPQFDISEPLPGIKPATQETLHLASPQSEPVGPVKPVAANGDDDAMSQPQKQS